LHQRERALLLAKSDLKAVAARSSPFCIDGYKFDMRVYVVATSFNPLKLYIFENGLVRFSTRQYKKVKKNSSNRSRFMHLTNYSVNKKSGA
jgi:hypothetical protein